jgi:hypothetical protein
MCRKLPTGAWPGKDRLQYIPAVQAEILYFRIGSFFVVKWLFILATAKRPI